MMLCAEELAINAQALLDQLDVYDRQRLERCLENLAADPEFGQVIGTQEFAQVIIGLALMTMRSDGVLTSYGCVPSAN